jgi:flagellar motor switch protein FliM
MSDGALSQDEINQLLAAPTERHGPNHTEVLSQAEIDQLLKAINAGDPESIERWEYTGLEGAVNSAYVTKANELGKSGWELVLYSNNYSIFKRRLP